MDRSVPNVVSLPVQIAQQRLEEQGLTFRVIGSGENVTLQMPAAGSVVAAKSQIVLFADAQPSEDLETVPDLTYLPYDIARQRLGYYALFISTDYRNISDSQTLLVSHQSVAPGEKVEHGTVIRVTPPKVSVLPSGEVITLHRATQDAFIRTVFWSLPEVFEFQEHEQMLDPDVAGTARVKELYQESGGVAPVKKAWWKFW